MKLLTIVGLLASAAIFGATSTPAEGRELLQVSFWHRHGAREGPILNSDGEIDWDYAMLTEPGERMGENLGKFMRDRYIKDHPDFLPTDFPQFDQDGRYKGVTGIDGRCIQTGFATARFMLGTEHEWNLPFIFIPPVDTDYDYSFMGNYPNEKIRDYLGAFYTNSSIAQSLFSETELAEMGKYIPTPELCANPEKASVCASLGYDYAQCYFSNQGWAAAPGLEALFPRLRQFKALSNRFMFGWNKDSPYAPMGSDAYNAAKVVLDRAESIIASHKAGAKATVPKLNQWSTHDNQIAGLMSTLGAVPYESTDPEMWVPRFTATITVEVFSDGNLTFWWATPLQAHGSGYNFTEYTPLRVSCITEDGEQYMSDECPLADARRFLETSAPQWDKIPAGAIRQCYLAPSDAAKCDFIGSSGDARTDKQCAYYRQYCPTNACGFAEDLVLDAAKGYQCVAVPLEEGKRAFWDKLSVAIPASAGAFVGAAVFGVGLSFLLKRPSYYNHADGSVYNHH